MSQFLESDPNASQFFLSPNINWNKILGCFKWEIMHWYLILGFPGGSAGKESACSVGDLGLILGLGRSPREGNNYPLQYSGLENSMDCIVHGDTKGGLYSPWGRKESDTTERLSLFSMRITEPKSCFHNSQYYEECWSTWTVHNPRNHLEQQEEDSSSALCHGFRTCVQLFWHSSLKRWGSGSPPPNLHCS